MKPPRARAVDVRTGHRAKNDYHGIEYGIYCIKNRCDGVWDEREIIHSCGIIFYIMIQRQSGTGRCQGDRKDYGLLQLSLPLAYMALA